ncbi:hypothetical protein [Priestia megaterium]|uniref:hypothetical protein n=1 Tax=Priestia megaterium TaxID=1404 RepID=UPI001865C4FC|nr:hypothetical protein [Priestia megaterium]MBE2975856.1 hypothetical protein [Priestia megaterium]MCY9018475.1 hypothetical protein [Priestia megaterium]
MSMQILSVQLLLVVDWRTGRRLPRKAKFCMEINGRVTSDPYQLIHPIYSALDEIYLVMSQSFFV